MLTRSVYAVSKTGEFARDFELARQIQRAAASAMSTVAKGFDRRGAGEFRHFLMIAKASCAEVKSLLNVALDAAYLDAQTFERSYAGADETARVIKSLHASIQPTRDGKLATTEPRDP